ncbi:MAG: response regulator [Anaerolineae bacterium]
MTKILVVEDEQDIRESIVDMLELDQHEVFEAANGKEALDVVSRVQPDLIISDIMMPEMDGHELFHALKKNLETSQTPFVFLTALANYEDLRKGMDLGADDYLIKPFTYQQLIKAVQTRLTKQAAENEYRLRQFIHSLIEIQEKTNEELANKLESFSQELLGLRLLLNNAGESSTLQPVNPQQKIEDIQQKLNDSTVLLNPISAFEQINLVSLLSWLFKNRVDSEKIKVDFQRSGHSIEFKQKTKLYIFRIFEEILANIIKHSQCSKIIIYIHGTKDAFIGSVEDNGTGFNSEKNLQADQVGIMQMTERVRMLGGELHIYSTESGGTKVSFSIPVQTAVFQLQEGKENPHSKLEIIPKESNLEGLDIIVAERQDIVRYGLLLLLENSFAVEKIRGAADSFELFQDISRYAPKLILLDLMLDEGSGFELLRSIKSQYPETYVIAFSAREQEIFAAEALKYGADGYLLKSASTAEMLEAVDKVLKGGKFISTRINLELDQTLVKRWGTTYSAIDSLTSREKEIILLVIDGLSSSEISEKLFVSKRTVEKHRSNLMNKLKLKTPTELISYVSEMSLLKERA